MNGVDEADLVVGRGHSSGHPHGGDLRCPRPGRGPAAGARHHGRLRAAAGLGRPAAGTGRSSGGGGTRHYGLGLARYLTGHGQQVSEIGCTRHIGKRRAGKSDPIDAVRAARELLARPGPLRCAPTATAKRCGC